MQAKKNWNLWKALSLSRASNNEKSVQCSTWDGKQLEDCDGFYSTAEKKKRWKCLRRTKKALMHLRTSQKRFFMCDVSFPYALEVLYQMKSEGFCRCGHQISLKNEPKCTQRKLTFKKIKRKGQKTQKGFSLSLCSLVFIVLMLIRCIVSLSLLQRRQRREICLIERGYKLRSSPVFFFLFRLLAQRQASVPLFDKNTKSAKTCGWLKITGWDFWYPKKRVESEGSVFSFRCLSRVAHNQASQEVINLCPSSA